MQSIGLLILFWGAGIAAVCLVWLAFRAGQEVYRNLKQRKTRIGNPSQAA